MALGHTKRSEAKQRGLLPRTALEKGQHQQRNQPRTSSSKKGLLRDYPCEPTISINSLPNHIKMNWLSLQSVPLLAPTTSVQQPHRTTLARRAQGKIDPRHIYRDHVSLLSAQQQLTLVNEINRLTDHGLPPTCAIVRKFAEDVVKKRPGKNWAYEFVKRHQKVLKSGFLAAADLSCKKADDAYQYTLYFELVCSLLNTSFCTNILKVRAKIEQYGVLPQNTYNMDEKAS